MLYCLQRLHATGKKSHSERRGQAEAPPVEHRPLSISAVLSSVQEQHHPGVWICFSSLSCCFCQETPCCLFVLPVVLMAVSTERIENPSLSRRDDWMLECLLLLNSFVSCWTVHTFRRTDRGDGCSSLRKISKTKTLDLKLCNKNTMLYLYKSAF